MTKSYELLINVVSASLSTKYKDINPTYEQIEEEVKMFSKLYSLTEEEYKKAIKTLNSCFVHSISYATTLKGENSEHFPWYKKSSNNSFYWNRYNEYLRLNLHWSPEIIKRLNETSDEIMENVGNPKSINPFQRRGLILGDVQSGKTANYTAVCNKAVDSGYKIIIVLAGMMENLRVQTQMRLDTEFVGKTSKYILDKKVNHVILDNNIGVGSVELSKNKTNKQITCFTSVTTDFKAGTIKAVNLSLNNLKGAALFVVKKNKSILTNLYSWLKSNNLNIASGLIDLPVLVIDDESDNASVNTNPDDKSPTSINKAIRDILHLFKQASYIGITATPFANIFINPDEDPTIAEDLFPKDFITLLPVPEKYIGAEKIFGKANVEDWESIHRDDYLGEYKNSLIPIFNEEQLNFFVYKHKKELEHNLTDIPESLKTAIRYFILSCAITDFRKDEKSHRSMLVNVSRFTNVQNITTDIISNQIRVIKYALESYSALDDIEELKCEEIDKLFKVWENFDLSSCSNTSWNNILHNYLLSAIQKIQISAVNQKHGAKSLDYYKYVDYGKRIIAVGGNSLSRGITLEGLIVSYFYRNTMMYDTLLQMGRWFGYRDGYNDLFKIWMGEDIIDSYGYISDAVNELKEEIKVMNRQNLTPSDFGLKVRQAPSSLIVTARNKMRNGVLVKMPISVSGRMIETPRLFSTEEKLKNNENICIDFIKRINQINNIPFEKSKSSYLWRDIPKTDIINFINKFETHPWNLNFQTSALARYINEPSNNLDYWDIGIPFGYSTNNYKIELENTVLNITPELRTIKKDFTIKDMIKISGRHVRVGSGGSSKIGLTKKELEEIKKNNNKLNDKNILNFRTKPILIIHILEKKDDNDLEIPKYVFALGLGFPGGKEDKTACYVVNPKELEKYIDTEDLEDYDDI